MDTSRADRGDLAGIDHDRGRIEVFATGATLLRDRDDVGDGGSGGGDHPVRDLVRHGGQSVRDGIAHLGDYHARPGHRPGAAPASTSARRGGDTDIVRPLLVDPTVALRIVCTGTLFEQPVPHLRVLPHDPAAERLLVWPVSIAVDRRAGVPASLHLLASPSMVVTVLELVPRRRVRFGRDRFVRTAVGAIDELARRIERAAA